MVSNPSMNTFRGFLKRYHSFINTHILFFYFIFFAIFIFVLIVAYNTLDSGYSDNCEGSQLLTGLQEYLT